jgi:hypothetical protein
MTPAAAAHVPKRAFRSAPPLRREALRDALPAVVQLLHGDRLQDAPAGYVDDYVALAWLHWEGGRLELTESGRTLCGELSVRQTPGAESA